ncbi:kelch repeat-containing protein [Streptomyces sp. MS1.HAVA.3]|uniref:Kelch repeat-containing protein n=1 Tax=Streptomyces caledonius TaxID=3134107 RepID=A0ABU8UBW6_9ACTN
MNTAEAYSPATDTWRTLPALPTARYALAGATAPCPKDVEGLRGICVYAIGGFTGASWPDSAFDTSTVEAYSPATNTWKTLPGLPTARSQLAASTAPCPKGIERLKGACVYAIGGAFGDTVEAYSPATNTWQTLPSLGTGRDARGRRPRPVPRAWKG